MRTDVNYSIKGHSIGITDVKIGVMYENDYHFVVNLSFANVRFWCVEYE